MIKICKNPLLTWLALEHGLLYNITINLTKSINLLLLFADLILTLKVIFMTKNNLIKLFTIIVLFIIAGISIKVVSYVNEPTQIFEIPNSVQYDEDTEFNSLFITKYYVVTNAPDNPSDIKNLIVEYYKKNKKKIEALEGVETEIKNINYEVVFYKESWNFTRNWKPDLTYIDDDNEYILNQIRDFSSQCIGYFSFNPITKEDTKVFILSNDEIIETYKVSHDELE